MKKTVNTKKTKIIDTIITIICVVQNDEDIIQERLKEINNALKKLRINYEILVVDNNSQDNTIESIKELQKKVPFIRILILSKSYDEDIAATAGLDNCIGDYAVFFNIYRDPVSILPSIAEKLYENVDIIVGKTDKPIVPYGIASKLFLWIIERLSTHNFTYGSQHLLAVSRKAINSIIRTRRKSRNFSYINNLIGFKKYILSYFPLETYSDKQNSENFFKVFFNVADIIISNSYKPIRFLTFLGVFVSVLFLLYVIIISIIYFFFDRAIAPQGWISLAFVMGAMFLLLFSILTLISEYIIRTLHEARNEPLYFIAEEIDKSIILSEEDKLNIV